MRPPILITGLDNTLYSWVDYFALSFRARIHIIKRETGVAERIITQDLRWIYREYGSTAHSEPIQELDLWKSMPTAEAQRLLHSAQVAFV